MTDTRIYRVTDRSTQVPRLVEASNPAAAIRHVAKLRYAVDVPSAKEVAALMSSGYRVEVAGADNAGEAQQAAVRG